MEISKAVKNGKIVSKMAAIYAIFEENNGNKIEVVFRWDEEINTRDYGIFEEKYRNKMEVLRTNVRRTPLEYLKKKQFSI